MTGCPTPLELYDYQRGRVADALRAEIETHLRECTSCQQKLSGATAFDDAVRQNAENAAPPEIAERLTALGDTIWAASHGTGNDDQPSER